MAMWNVAIAAWGLLLAVIGALAVYNWLNRDLRLPRRGSDQAPQDR